MVRDEGGYGSRSIVLDAQAQANAVWGAPRAAEVPVTSSALTVSVRRLRRDAAYLFSGTRSSQEAAVSFAHSSWYQECAEQLASGAR